MTASAESCVLKVRFRMESGMLGSRPRRAGRPPVYPGILRARIEDLSIGARLTGLAASGVDTSV